MWRIRHFYVTKMGIPPCWMGTYKWWWRLGSGPKPMLFAVLAFRLCRRSASRQGHGLRFAPGTRLAQFPGTLAALTAANCAPGPCTPRPYAGRNLNCQKANRTGGHEDA